MTRLILLAAFPLAACGGQQTPPQPIIVPQEVLIPTTVSCVPLTVAEAPAYPDTTEALRAAAGPAERYQLIAGGRKLRDARLNVLEPVVASCRK
jgi:hypothetical protein